MRNLLLAHGDSDFLVKSLINLTKKFPNKFTLTSIFSHKDSDLYKGFNFINLKDLYFEKSTLDNNYPYALNNNEISHFKKECFYDFINQLDRLAVFPNSTQRNIDLFYRALSFFLSYLKNKNINVVIFQTTPHMGLDYILFHVAKFLKIKTIIFFRTYYQDKILIADDYRTTKTFFVKNPNYRKNFNNLKYKISTWGQISKQINTKVHLPFFLGFFNFLFLLLKKIYYMYFLKQFHSAAAFNHINFFQFFFLNFKHLFKIYYLMKFYENISINSFNFKKKILFLALHNQPEKTTQPEGQNFDFQYNAIKFLSLNLSKDYIILIKEHPKQLNPYSGDLRQLHFRDKFFYKKILNLKNCHFVSLKINSEKLIKESKIIATITGSVAWESLTLNRPSVSFSNTWHSDCKSSPSINKENFSKIIKMLEKKKEKDIVNDKNLFINKIKSKFFHTVISDFEYKKSPSNKNLLRTNMELALKNILIKNYK